LRRAIAEVDYEAVKEDCIAGQPQLDCAKKAIPACDFYPAMISIPVDLGATQEIPSLPTGEQRSGGNECHESGGQKRRAVSEHGGFARA